MPGPTILSRLGRAGQRPFFGLEQGRIPWQIHLVDEDLVPVHPVLILDWVEWEGPLDPGLERRGDLLPSDPSQVRERLEHLARRAFRRPVREGELHPYERLVESELAGGSELRAAFKTALLALLCSKDFLYLIEGSADGADRLLTDWELASRLAYFLWSTMPDDELLELAGEERLRDREVLRSQVARMLADPRAERLAASFSRQWLQLGRVGEFSPNVDLYPDYDPHLERSMVQETVSFVGEVLRRDLSVRELLVSDWTMLNPRLARHYGIEGVSGSGFRRVALEADHHRGGILTQASVLSLTSDGTRHRPVHRGVWISESIFGRSPPPPPANVEPIEPTPVDAEKATVRMQLRAHASNPACAACHSRIDPLGLAFDNYDAIGRWRTREHVPTGRGPDPPVDASGTLPDGRSFSGPDQFLDLLADDLDRFHAALVEKLATYALRRTMSVDDRAHLADIASRSAADGYRLRRLVETLVLSDLFLRR